MERIVELRPELVQAMLETFAMIGVAIPVAVLLGTPLGIWLFVHAPGSIAPQPRMHAFVSGLVNMLRSFPFLILLIAIIPVTRFVVGTTVGTAAAIVPLTINAIPYFARLVEQNINVALALVSRCYVLDHGTVVLEDSADSIRENEKLRHELLGV